jgi:predicted SAM-dependent methyltransferase
MLNLGSGTSKKGDVRLDIYPLENVNCVYDIEKGIPFGNEVFDDIFCQCVFEHMRNPSFILSECYRVLKKGGKMTIITDNAGYLLYHVWKRNRHGGYCDGTGGTEKKDRHYALYTREHMINHFEIIGFKVKKVEHIMLGGGKHPLRRKFIQKFIKFFFSERVGYPRLHCEVEK